MQLLDWLPCSAQCKEAEEPKNASGCPSGKLQQHARSPPTAPPGVLQASSSPAANPLKSRNGLPHGPPTYLRQPSQQRHYSHFFLDFALSTGANLGLARRAKTIPSCAIPSASLLSQPQSRRTYLYLSNLNTSHRSRRHCGVHRGKPHLVWQGVQH